MSKRNFKYSVVMPVYNVEEYLEESIESIVNQTIGFEENIQLILVNDGSPDNSGEICEKYKEKYPENIVYIKQENSGVSVARNTGLDFVKGEYVNFLDSDDLWNDTAFADVYDFFEENKEEIDVVTAKIQNFEGSTKEHATHSRHRMGSRVCDLNDPDEYSSVIVQVASSFFKAEAVKNVRFVKDLKLGEDSMFVNTVIMEKMKAGIVNDAVYYYRRRENLNSAVQSLTRSKYYYIDRLQDYHLALIKSSLEKFGEVKPYIQNVVYYDFGWHLYHDVSKALGDEDYKEFLSLCKEILSYIDDSVIIQNEFHKPMTKKAVAMKLKYGEEVFFKNCFYDKETQSINYGETVLVKTERNKYICNIYFAKIETGYFVIEGSISDWVTKIGQDEVQLFLKVGDKKVKMKLKDDMLSSLNTCFGQETKLKRFSHKVAVADIIDKDGLVKIRPILRFGKTNAKLGMNYGKFVPTTNAFATSYKFYGEYCMECFRTVIKINKFNSRMKKILYILKRERQSRKYLRKIDKKDIAKIRKKYLDYKIKGKIKDKIWLVSDRVENAGDNGEVFFKYLCQHKPEGVRPIFAISKNAACVDRLKSEGEVVFFEDEEYLMYFLFADKIISSGASEFTMNPFGTDRKYLIDLFNFKYYYLQHGVACADLSGWLNRYAKDLHRIFASSERERDSFLEAPYYYSKSQIKIAGQARFDDLYDEKEKLILILPTWRKAIKQSYDSNTTSVYFDGFKDTEYFKYYNNLINDERLLSVMRKHGYKGLFCMHPIHKEQTIDYTQNDVFSVNQGYVDYNDVFARAALTVTDYSSVLFDFVYLKKPVIYTQFDKEEFFACQTYDEGYFSYENDGFGPVCYDYESTVSALIAAVERDCKNEEKYLERIGNFFKFDDKNNSARILNEIEKS